jgi:hypothetical protein
MFEDNMLPSVLHIGLGCHPGPMTSTYTEIWAEKLCGSWVVSGAGSFALAGWSGVKNQLAPKDLGLRTQDSGTAVLRG